MLWSGTKETVDTGVRLRILLNPIGSRGDIQPLVALGQRLRAAGHEVRVAGSPNGRDLVAAHGLDFVPVGQDVRAWIEQRSAAVSNPLVLAAEIGRFLPELIDEQFADLGEHVAWADGVLMGGVTLATACLCEAHGAP